MRGKQRAAKAKHVLVCVVGEERRGEREEERGKVAAGKASQGRERGGGRGK